MQKVLEKVKKSPGKSWNLNQFFWWKYVDIANYNVSINGRNFMINQLMIKSKSMMKLERLHQEKGHDYTTGCLLDYQYFRDHYQLIAVDLSKQKELDADPRAIQQVGFYGMLNTNSQVCTVLRKIKRNCIRILQRNSKSVVGTYKWLNTTQYMLNYQIHN